MNIFRTVRRTMEWGCVLLVTATVIVAAGTEEPRGYHAVILEDPAKGAFLIRADQVRFEGGRVFFTEKGRETSYLQSQVVTYFENPPGPGQTTTAFDAKTALSAIDSGRFVLEKNPTLEKLRQEWQTVADQLAKGLVQDEKGWVDAAAERKARFQEELSKLTEPSFEPKAPYTRDEVAARVRLGESLLSAYPDQRDTINKAAKPWKDELARFDAGEIKTNGVWLTPERLQRLQQRRATMTYRDNLDAFWAGLEPVPLPGQLAESGTLGIAILTLAGAAVLLLIPVCVYLTSTHRNWTTAVPAIVSANLLIASGFVITQLLADPLLMPATQSSGRDKLLQRAYFETTHELPATIPEFTFGDNDWNAFFNRVFTFSGSEGGWAWTRKRWVFGVASQKITLFEESRLMAIPITLTYEIPYRYENGQLKLGRPQVWAGRLPISQSAGARLWNQTEPILAQALATFHPRDYFDLTGLEKDGITLRRRDGFTPDS
jgi:hypothetical protein